MPIRTDLWKVSANPQPLPEAKLVSEKMLEDMIIAAPRLLSDEWMLIGRQEDRLRRAYRPTGHRPRWRAGADRTQARQNTA